MIWAAQVYHQRSVNDVCPGDGAWAEFYVRIFYLDGEHTDHLVEDDMGGCDGYGETFSKTYDRTGRIELVGLLTCEDDAGHITSCTARYKNNPYTG